MLEKLMGGNNIKVPEIEDSTIPKTPKIKLFDYVKQISSSNTPIEVDSGYSEFMINRIFSEFIDCVLVVGQANRTKFLDSQSHFNFLQKSITTKTNRFNKKQMTDNTGPIKFILLSLLFSYKGEITLRESMMNLSFLTEDEISTLILKNKNYFRVVYEKTNVKELSKFNKSEIE